MKFTYYILSVLLFFCIPAKAQPIVIKGKAPFHTGKEIGIYVYDDLITKKEIKKSSVIVKENGEFELKLETDKTQISFLKIENEKANLFVEPDSNYSVFFPPKDSMVFTNPNLDRTTDLIIDSKDSLELNSLIIDYNQYLNKFWLKNYQYFVVNRGRAKLDSFAKATLERYAAIKNNYFQNHIRYSLASLDYNSKEMPINTATKKYFYDQPVLYKNYEYMQLFHSVFRTYFFNKDGPQSGIFKELGKSKPSFEDMLNILTSDKLLSNRALRELVLLKILQDDIYLTGPEMDYMKKNIVLVLEQTIKQSTVEEHKKIARNILDAISKLVKGAEAPSFELLDKTGKKVTLVDFKGKYVYLDFWATWCGPCLQEIKVMPELKKKYGSKIVFLSISIDNKIETMNTFLAKNPKYDWVFVHCNSKTKNDYGIKAVPLYFLIDPDGKFLQCPAERPSGDIEAAFNAIMKRGGEISPVSFKKETDQEIVKKNIFVLQ